jgi:transposase InsO family protein
MTRQNYYARRRERARRKVDGELVAQLVRKERKTQPRLGARKLRVLLNAELAEAGVEMGRDRFFEELRRRDLLVKRRRSEHAHTTNSRHALPVFGNLIKDREVSQPNEVWVGDLTYVRTGEDFLYLALLTDKYSRKIVGFHCGDTLEAIGCIKALEMALADLPEGAQPIHHSDRGCQYCCHDYARKLQQKGLAISMTETNHSAENALAERVNGILKTEYDLGGQFATKKEARRAVDQAIHLYNTRRPHMALGYRIPEMVHSLAE